jgi:hypothetical protein
MKLKELRGLDRFESDLNLSSMGEELRRVSEIIDVSGIQELPVSVLN